MSIKVIAFIGFVLLYATFCSTGQHRYGDAHGQDLGTADIEVFPTIEVIPVEKLVYDLSEDDALIATCSGLLLIVGKTEAASWYATILDQKMITDFLFDVISTGLEDGDFTNEELEDASRACIVVMEKSKAT